MTAALVRMLGRRRRLLVVSTVVLVAGGLASGLLAYFSGAASAGSAGGAAATSVAPGTPPTSVSSQPGRAVTISWEATTLANGQPVDGYLVTRYDANLPYAPQITLAGCGGVVTALSCTETAVPFGSWQYTITPVIGANWRGTESTKSGAVTIGAASLALSQSTLGLAAFSGGSSPAALSGSLSGFASDEGITFRLDDSMAGTTLVGSPAVADASGNATVSITLPRPTEGSHSIFAVGNAVPYPSQVSAAILVDTLPPTSSASGVDAAWHASDVVVDLSADDGVGASGVETITYAVDGGSSQTIPAASGNVTVPAPPDGSNDGTHTIAYYATDEAGNVEAPAKTATVKIDTTKPSTTLATAPAAPDGSNGWYQQGSVQFTLTGTDAHAGVAQSFYTVDGGGPQAYTGAVTVSGQGDHTVTYWSVDNAGNTESTNTTHIKLDNVKPSTSIAVTPASPNGAGGWYVTNPSFTLSASDATSGVASTLYKIDSGTTQTYSGAVSIPDGQHTVTYWTVDTAGNTESAATTSTIKIDTVKPSTSITINPASPDGSNGWRVSATSFTLGGSDATSGVASTFYKIDGGATQTYTGSAVSITQGSHTVTYWSVDTAGNTESATTTPAITVDLVKPSTTLTTAPATPDGSNNWFKQASVTFTLAATDATSGVANRFYTIDGGSTQTYSGTVTVNTQGDHTVTYWSDDNAGNTENTNTTHIKLDNVAPTNSLALTNKTGGSFLSGNTVWYRGVAAGSFSIQNTVSDATSGPASSTFPALGGTGGAGTWTHTTPDVKTTPADGPYVSNSFGWTAGTTGTRTEVVTAADDAGNTASAPSLTFTNDSTVPVTTDNTGTIGATCKNTTQTVTLSPTDAASGAATTYYTTNGSTPTTSSSQGTSIVLSTDGSYTIKYFTVDNVGNNETVKTGSALICIDKTAPAPTNIVLGTGNGTAASGDTVTITYSEVLDATTFCSTWSNGSTQTLSGASVVVQIADTGANDTLTVTAVGAGNCGGTANFHVGSIALGGNYVAATRTFSSITSRLQWNPTTRTLQIRLGAASGAVLSSVPAGTPVYTPDSTLEDIAGNTIVASPFSAPGTSRF